MTKLDEPVRWILFSIAFTFFSSRYPNRQLRKQSRLHCYMCTSGLLYQALGKDGSGVCRIEILGRRMSASLDTWSWSELSIA